MSFTPDNPTGFDPCGVAFGAVRVPYSADCRFFADSALGSNRINWYIVPDDTPDYEGPSPFWPRIDVPQDEAHTDFEREGPGYVRDKDWTLAYLPPLPVHGVHGDEQDFLGLSPSDKYEVDGDPPLSPCIVARKHFAELLLGARPITPRPSFTSRAGLLLGARETRPIPVERSGLLLGAPLLRPAPRLQAGLRVNARLKSGYLQSGLRFGARLYDDLPGSTCDTAMLVSIGITYTFSCPDNTQMWFKWLVHDTTTPVPSFWHLHAEPLVSAEGTGYLQSATDWPDDPPGSNPCFLGDAQESTFFPDYIDYNATPSYPLHTGTFFQFHPFDNGGPTLFSIRLEPGF